MNGAERDETTKNARECLAAAVVDQDRELFDSLISAPGGANCNPCLVQGIDRAASLNSVEPPMEETLVA